MESSLLPESDICFLATLDDARDDADDVDMHRVKNNTKQSFLSLFPSVFLNGLRACWKRTRVCRVQKSIFFPERFLQKKHAHARFGKGPMQRAALRLLFSSSSAASSAKPTSSSSSARGGHRRPSCSSSAKSSTNRNFPTKRVLTASAFACCYRFVSMSSSSAAAAAAAAAAGASRFSEYNSPPPFVVETGSACDKAIIFLHGLGDAGRGWSDIPNQSSLGDIKNVR